MDVMKRQTVAEYLDLPISTLDYLVQTGQIPFSRIGKRTVRFDKAEIDTWFKNRAGVEYRQNRNGNGGKN